jgi:protein SCO1/2
MAAVAMNSIVPALVSAAMLLAACGSETPAQPEQPPLAGARIGGPFALTDQNGRQVRDTDFAGRWRMVYFGYTYCPDVCPTDMAKLGQAMRLLEKQAPREAAKLAPIFISVDPERDTPAVLKQFVANFHPRFTGLTGTPEAVAQVARSYAVYAKKQPPSEAGGYLVDHAAVAFLMDSQGKPIVSLPIDKDAGAVAEQLRHWIR